MHPALILPEVGLRQADKMSHVVWKNLKDVKEEIDNISSKVWLHIFVQIPPSPRE